MRELVVLFVSALPISELRGGIPLALALGLTPAKAFIISIIGNVLPVPFLLLFLEKLKNLFLRVEVVERYYKKIEARVLKKKRIVEKYGYIGLALFVAIPFPATGAWTGSLLATLLDLEFKKSLIFISLGVIMAGCIVLSASLGLLTIPKILF